MKTLSRRPLAASLLVALALGHDVGGASPLSPADLEMVFDSTSARHPGQAPTRPASMAVTNCDDSGPGSLRDAVSASDTVDLTTLTCSRITLTSGAIHATQRLDLTGPGADKLTIDAQNRSRVIEADTDINLKGLSIVGGHAEGDGGCIRITGGTNLVGVVVSDCSAHAAASANGGGIHTTGYLYLEDSTIERNTVTSDTGYAAGGGVNSHGLHAVRSTIADNAAESDAGMAIGGGAFADFSFHIESSTINGNRADTSAAIALFSSRPSTATISASTISGNEARKHIGGAFFDSPTTITDSTIAFNCATETSSPYQTGIGLQTRFHAPKLYNSIVAKNGFCATERTDSPFDLGTHDTTESVGGDHDLVMLATVPLPPGTRADDPQLAPLADNGGPTQTHALLVGSPAIDAGKPMASSYYDQRGTGFTRLVGANVDIGAFEVQSTGVSRPVRNCDDDGEGSLRRLVANAASGDTIDLRDSGCARITLASGQLVTTAGNLHLIGPGSAALTIDGGMLDRVLAHQGHGVLELDGLTIANGRLDVPGKALGGCILSTSSIVGNDLVVSGCNAQSASDLCNGGGIYAMQGLDLADSRVIGNTCAAGATVNGGGVDVGGNLHLARVTVAGNSAVGTQALGGGISVGNNAVIDSSAVTGNSARLGAGLFVTHLALTDSTVSGNTALLAVAGGFASTGDIVNSTIAFNMVTFATTPVSAGLVTGGRIESSILFGNTIAGIAYDIGSLNGTAITGSHNIVGYSPSVLPSDTIHADPLLAPLAMNGGPTETHALQTGSPAIDAGSNVAGLSFDQRGDGFGRVDGAAADIGAYEAHGVSGDHIFNNDFERIIQR